MHLYGDTKPCADLLPYAAATYKHWPKGRASSTAGYGSRHEGRAYDRAISPEGRLCHQPDTTLAPPRQNRGVQWSPAGGLLLASLLRSAPHRSLSSPHSIKFSQRALPDTSHCFLPLP